LSWKREAGSWQPAYLARSAGSDASDWDLGYTRTVQRPDGKLVTVYYYNDATSTERYIGATIWVP
jgi:hypothetical protein